MSNRIGPALTMSNVPHVLAALLILAATACGGAKSAKSSGACEVAFDSLGSKGAACTVVSEAECKDDMSPAVMDLATSKTKTFTPGKRCADVGYAKVGCPGVPTAWSFQSACPTP